MKLIEHVSNSRLRKFLLLDISKVIFIAGKIWLFIHNCCAAWANHIRHPFLQPCVCHCKDFHIRNCCLHNNPVTCWFGTMPCEKDFVKHLSWKIFHILLSRINIAVLLQFNTAFDRAKPCISSNSSTLHNFALFAFMLHLSAMIVNLFIPGEMRFDRWMTVLLSLLLIGRVNKIVVDKNSSGTFYRSANHSA